MGKRPFPDPEQAPPQTAQKKPDDSGRTCSYQQNKTIIRIKYSRSKRFEPSSYPFPSIRQELLPRGLPTSRKSLKRTGEERAALAAWRRKGKRGGAPPFYRKFPLPPPTLFPLSYDFTGRGPKMSVPTRTRVAPSSTACTQSPDMPMESSGSLMPRRASRSSRSSRSRAK